DPLLWIIDSAPFWLGIFARYAGMQRDSLLQAIDGGERRFQTIMNNAPLVFFAINKDGVITLSEGQGLQALGHEPGEVVGQSVFELYKDSPTVLECVELVLSGQPTHSTVTVKDMTFETRYVPLLADQEVTGAIGIAMD